MDSQDQRSAVKRIVSILKKITRVVQLIPFVYLLLLGMALLLDGLMPGWSQRMTDALLCVPAYVSFGMIGVGKILKLCSWFKASCLIPLSTKVYGWIDSFVITFTQNEVIVINVALGVSFIAFIIIAQRHFFNGGRKARA